MDLNTIVTLLNAGYTKSEIDALISGTSAPAAPAAPVVTEAQVEDVKTLVKTPVDTEPVQTKVEETPQPAQAPVYTMTQDQLNQLIQGVAVKTTAGTIDMPKTIDDTLRERLQSIINREA